MEFIHNIEEICNYLSCRKDHIKRTLTKFGYEVEKVFNVHCMYMYM